MESNENYDNNIEVMSMSSLENSPLTESEYVKTIYESYEELHNKNDSKEMISSILSKIIKKTNKFKFIVQTINFYSKENKKKNIDLECEFGAFWDMEKDGYINIKIETKNVETEIDKERDEESQNDLIDGVKADEETKKRTFIILIYWILTN